MAPTPLSEDHIKPIIYQVLRSLNYLKMNNVIHRDLKPENIMLESYRSFQSEKDTFIKIIDFGYSLDLNADMSDSQLEILGQLIMGTLTYVAPELIQESEDVLDQFQIESDMWSLGVIIYALLAGRHPFFA